MKRNPDHELLELRRNLHRYPGLSGNEDMASRLVSDFLIKLEPDDIINNLGGKGIAARFKGIEAGPRVMVRAELDALPINESIELEYQSTVRGVSHKCGHDGHMAIIAGVAKYFSRERPSRGELVVLFQPSEETGEGAFKVVNDRQFKLIEPDYIMALHNLPGFESGEVILGRDVFAAASAGMIIELTGKTSHAAEPEKGRSPAAAVAEIILEFPRLSKGTALVTIIHVRIGEKAFGTNPGNAVVMATLRALDDGEMESLIRMAELTVGRIAMLNELEYSVKWTEKFPSTVNDPDLVRMIEKVGNKQGCKVRYIEKAFRWSEDFGWFTQKYRGVLFGLGAGKGHPELHSSDYDFPDELIGTGVNMITQSCSEIFKSR
jgi:amidohydrolase